MALKSATAGPDINLEMFSWTKSLATKLMEKTSSVADIFGKVKIAASLKVLQ